MLINRPTDYVFELNFFVDPCKASRCMYHSVCGVIPDGSTECRCPRLEDCPDVNDPVCGMNGKTYESECKLKAESCAAGIEVTMKDEGPCGRKTNG